MDQKPPRTPPEEVLKRTARLGLHIVAWDEQRGSVQRRDPLDSSPYSARPTFIGTHDEVLAYVQAWEHLHAERVIEQEPAIRDSMLVIRSHVPIPPGSYAQVCTRTQIPFRGRRIAIPNSIARHFRICDVRVGMCSMFPCSQEIPGEAMAVNIEGMPTFRIANNECLELRMPDAGKDRFGQALTMTTCQPGQDITVVVRCIDDGPWMPHDFEMLILGETIHSMLTPMPPEPPQGQAKVMRSTLTDVAVPSRPGVGWDPDPDLLDH